MQLYNIANERVTMFSQIEIGYVPRESNYEADQLANLGMDLRT